MKPGLYCTYSHSAHFTLPMTFTFDMGGALRIHGRGGGVVLGLKLGLASPVLSPPPFVSWQARAAVLASSLIPTRYSSLIHSPLFRVFVCVSGRCPSRLTGQWDGTLFRIGDQDYLSRKYHTYSVICKGVFTTVLNVCTT